LAPVAKITFPLLRMQLNVIRWASAKAALCGQVRPLSSDSRILPSR